MTWQYKQAVGVVDVILENDTDGAQSYTDCIRNDQTF